jgi:hypothetical protein
VKRNLNSPPLGSTKNVDRNGNSQSQININQIPGPGYYDISNKFITSKYPRFGNVKLAPQIL